MSIPSTANDLRRAFTGYFAERGHSPVESASLIPHDPTVLFTVAGMVLFPYTSSALACVLVFAVFYFAMNVKYDTYPFIAYDIARKPYWGRVNGLNLVLGGIATWLGQTWFMPLMDVKGDFYVYVLAAAILAIASVATVVFSKEPPLRTETPPDYNPLKVIGHVIRVGFSDKRIVQLLIADFIENFRFLSEIIFFTTYETVDKSHGNC